jgi:hypothetical protein
MIRLNNRWPFFRETVALCLAGAPLARGCTASTLNPKKHKDGMTKALDITLLYFGLLWFFPIGALESATKKFFQRAQLFVFSHWDGHPIPQLFHWVSTVQPLN